MKIYTLIKTLATIGAIISLAGASSAMAAPTGGSGGQLTNSTNQSYTGSKYTSKYHLYASGLDWSKPVGMLIYADGSAEYGLKNLNSTYLMAGTDGLINVAKRNNMVLLTPLSPNNACDDGDGSCWYMGDSVGYTKWAEELVTHVQGRYNIDKDRVAFGGYSSGAQLATEWWVPSGAAQRTMTDGVVVAISYGGSPKMTEISYSNDFKSKVHMNWNTGDKDSAYTTSSQYGVKAGYNAYTSKQFKTSLDVISGLGHNRSDFGKVMDAQIKKHVPAGSDTTTPTPTPTPVDPMAACINPGANFGTITKEIQLPNSGNYTIWTRTMKSGANNKFMLQVGNDKCAEIVSTSQRDNQWEWVKYPSSSLINLRGGSHTIKMIGTQPGVKIDRILILPEGSCSTGPTGNGDNCTTAPDTTPPALDVSSPDNNSTVNGNVPVSIFARDAISNTKVQILVNGRLMTEMRTEQSSNYNVGYLWDSNSVQNGRHQITVNAIDDSGNIARDVRTVTVLNGDTEKPSAPTQLNAKSESGNVVLSWKLSTDNIGVAGYTIYRNGDNIVGTSTGEFYIDENVLPGTSYTYSVAAKDAAGNTNRSSEVRITTPQAEDTQAPTTPGNLKIESSSSAQINLRWNASTDNVAVAGYDIYRSTSNDAFVKTASTSSTSFGDSNIKPKTSYAYYVIARDAKGNVSNKSNTIQTTTPDVKTPPTTPGDNTPTTPVEETGTIRGRVTNSSRKPLSGVHVIATSQGKKYSATTNSNGVYRIENVPSGRYSLTFTHDNYKSDSSTVRVRASRNVVVDERLANKPSSKNSSSSSWWSKTWSRR